LEPAVKEATKGQSGMSCSIELTFDEWDLVLDALSACRGEALARAAMWAGRGREDGYRDEAAKLADLWDKIEEVRHGVPKNGQPRIKEPVGDLRVLPPLESPRNE
jgi:hypothetical protein